MQRKILFVDIAINISIITLFLSGLLVFFIGNRLYEKHLMNNGYYTKNKCSFKLPTEISTYNDIKNIYLKCMENTILYKDMSPYEDLRGVLLKGNIDGPPIIEGRFFAESDFYNKNYYAVIGTNQKENMYESNNRFYIDLAGHPYEVIGIVGSEKDRSLLDYTIYVNLDSFSEMDNGVGLYHLDGISGESVKQTLARLGKDLNVINLGDYGILNVFYGQIPGFSLLICVGLAFISFYIFFSYEWFRSRHQLSEVMTIIGLGHTEKFKEISLQYLQTILPSLVSGVIVSALLFFIHFL